MARKKTKATPKPPKAQPPVVPTPAPETAPTPIHTPESKDYVVLAQATSGPDSITIVQCGHKFERTVAIDSVIYEYTGDDAEGRRIYRNMTRAQ